MQARLCLGRALGLVSGKVLHAAVATQTERMQGAKQDCSRGALRTKRNLTFVLRTTEGFLVKVADMIGLVF